MHRFKKSRGFGLIEVLTEFIEREQCENLKGMYAKLKEGLNNFLPYYKARNLLNISREKNKQIQYSASVHKDSVCLTSEPPVRSTN